MATEVNPKEFYEENKKDRKQYEDRALLYAKASIPYLYRDESWTSSSASDETGDYTQAYVALLVNNFVNSVGLTLLPPNRSAFKYTPDKEALVALAAKPKARTKVYKELGSAQNKVNDRLEALNTRQTMFNVLAHMTVVSSCVVEKKAESYKIHTLSSFVVELNDAGFETAICVRELLTLNQVEELGFTTKEVKDDYELHSMLDLMEDGRWLMTYSLDGEPIGEEQTFTDKTRPFYYSGWEWNTGEKYHRPYIAKYFGIISDLQTSNSTMRDGSALSALTYFTVDERAGRTRVRDVAGVKMGSVIQGSQQDISANSVGKGYDYNVTVNYISLLERRLAHMFLFEQGLIRDAERVTAEEIRALSKSVEKLLASSYANAIKVLERFIMWAEDDLGIDLKTVKADIIVGLSALGGNREAQDLDEWVMRGGQMGYADRIDKNELAVRYGNAGNIELDGLLLSEEDFAKQQQAQQQQAMLQQGGEALAQSAGKSAGEQTAQPQQ